MTKMGSHSVQSYNTNLERDTIVISSYDNGQLSYRFIK